MVEYEVLVEDINPCAGESRAVKNFLEVQTADPRVWVEQNGRFPILEDKVNADGDRILVTGDGSGNMVRYTFTE